MQTKQQQDSQQQQNRSKFLKACRDITTDLAIIPPHGAAMDVAPANTVTTAALPMLLGHCAAEQLTKQQSEQHHQKQQQQQQQQPQQLQQQQPQSQQFQQQQPQQLQQQPQQPQQFQQQQPQQLQQQQQPQPQQFQQQQPQQLQQQIPQEHRVLSRTVVSEDTEAQQQHQVQHDLLQLTQQQELVHQLLQERETLEASEDSSDSDRADHKRSNSKRNNKKQKSKSPTGFSKRQLNKMAVEANTHFLTSILNDHTVSCILAQTLALSRKKVSGDGRCLFTGIMVSATECGVHLPCADGTALRAQLAEWMLKNKDGVEAITDYSSFVCDQTDYSDARDVSVLPYDQRVYNLTHNNEWGGELELSCLATMLKMRISIVTPTCIQVFYGYEDLYPAAAAATAAE